MEIGDGGYWTNKISFPVIILMFGLLPLAVKITLNI